MLFNSLHFLVFFPIVIFAYFAIPHRFRWILLLAASYYFYMCWRVSYALLIVASTLVDYVAAIQMGKTKEKRRRVKWLIASLAMNLGLLFAFKYFNFFSGQVQAAFDHFNLLVDVPVFKVLLPVGISFYTFQTLSYTIDVYRGDREPERHLGIFALYVAFFPQLVAGPIERSTRLIPQLHERREFDYDRVREGLIRMLLGFFKKVAIADRIAVIVNENFNNPGAAGGEQLIVATVLFAFQIYCDFSGYSDIAIGGAKIMGYDLMENFKRPYYARSIQDFWGRWHISLSTWFRDYLYIPLGGSRVSKSRVYFNLWTVFLLSGLWHGANWTFVAWGAYHGALLVVSRWLPDLKIKRHGVWDFLLVAFIFVLTCVGWILFRANSITDAAVILMKIGFVPALYLKAVLTTGPGALLTILKGWAALPFVDVKLQMGLAGILVLEAVHLVERRGSLAAFLAWRPLWLRWTVYSAFLWWIFLFGEFGAEPFMYFQF